MARFEFEGIDGLMEAIARQAELPDDVRERMLRAGGAVVKRAQEQELKRVIQNPTGQLAGSISISQKMKRDKSGHLCLHVYPTGKRKRGKAENNEVGFLLEYGVPGRGIKPTQWMRIANEKAEDEAVRAAEQVYEQWQRESGL